MSANDVTGASTPCGESTRVESLVVVMPVYNEGARLAVTLDEWTRTLARLPDCSWRLEVYDDGSRDDSPARLRAFAARESRVRVHAQPNAGHGPTVLAGYRAATEADWIFQTDSDGDLDPAALEELWRSRGDADFLAGRRTGRRQNPLRAALSCVSRWAVRLRFGRAIADVNVPFRLMRRTAFAPLFARVPARAFAPNVLLAGLAARAGLRVREIPVACRADRGNGVTPSRRLLAGAVRALFETLFAGVDGRRLFAGALVAAALAWGALYALAPQGVQARVFAEKGRQFFWDYQVTRQCAETGYLAWSRAPQDAAYTPFTLLLTRPFPASTAGGTLFTAAMLALFLAALYPALRTADSATRRLFLLGAAASAPVLYAVEWGNPVLLAGACTALFLAWYRSPVPAQRRAAAVALAAAAVLKIAPALLAVLWLPRRGARFPGRTVALFMGAGAVLFVAPFLFYGGLAGFEQWFANAAANAAHYVHKTAWGFVPIARTVRVAMGADVTQAWAGIGLERALAACLGALCLVAAVRRRGDGRAVFPAVAALLLLPGNMHFYTGVYLLAAWAVRPIGLAAACAAFATACPLQVPWGGACLNHPLANLAFLACVAGDLLTGGRAEGEAA